MEILMFTLIIGIGGAYLGNRQIYRIGKRRLSKRLRRRMIAYRHMHDEMDALRGEIQRQQK
jgi:hypothetical protein